MSEILKLSGNMKEISINPEVQSLRQELSLLKEQVKDLIDSGMGISGHAHWNGADWYECSVCRKSSSTIGYASTVGHLDDVDHAPDCALVTLYNQCKT